MDPSRAGILALDCGDDRTPERAASARRTSVDERRAAADLDVGDGSEAVPPS